jgi:hypothetical protein
MIEKKITSIEIFPCFILYKNKDKTILEIDKSPQGIKNVDSAPLINFERGDYLFMSKIVGEGFIQYNYVKMDEKDIKKYFPKLKEPEDRFSRFAGTSVFPNK